MDIQINPIIIDVKIEPTVIDVLLPSIVNVTNNAQNFRQQEFIYSALNPIVLSAVPTFIMTLAINGLLAEPKNYGNIGSTMNFLSVLELTDGDILNIIYY
jgi:hypothetical protein